MKNRILIFSFLFFAFACSNDENDIKQNVEANEFKFQFRFQEIETTTTGRVASNTSQQFILLDIEDDKGVSIKNDLLIHFVLLNGEILTQPISLPAGNYKIYEAAIVNQDGDFLYAIPKAGSPLANNAIKTLPASFTVSNTDNFETPLVDASFISTQNKTASDFGVSSLTIATNNSIPPNAQTKAAEKVYFTSNYLIQELDLNTGLTRIPNFNYDLGENINLGFISSLTYSNLDQSLYALGYNSSTVVKYNNLNANTLINHEKIFTVDDGLFMPVALSGDFVNGKLFWINLPLNGFIFQGDIQTRNLSIVNNISLGDQFSNVLFMKYNPTFSRLYFVDSNGQGDISYINLSNPSQVINYYNIPGENSIDGFDLGQVSGYVYYCSFLDDKIYVTNGISQFVLFEANDGVRHPRNLLVDEVSGKLFWFNAIEGTNNDFEIVSANLDGSGTIEYFDFDNVFPKPDGESFMCLDN